MASGRGFIRLIAAGGALGALLLSGCSFSIGGETVDDAVERELQESTASLLGLDEDAITIECGERADDEPGTEFECSAAGGSAPVRWLVRLDEDRRFDIVTINLATADGVDELESIVADDATRVFGTEVDAVDVECGERPTVLDAGLSLTCVVTDEVGEPVDAVVAFTDITETGDDTTAIASIVIDRAPVAGTAMAAAAAVERIEEESAALGLGSVEAVCDEPADEVVGTTFACSTATELGLVDWVVTITEDANISALTTNLVRADVADDLEAAAVASLEAETGNELGLENFECGPGPFVLDSDSAMVCALTEPATGQTYDATLTFTDLNTGSFRVTVANQPRP